ncbi:UMP kinase [Candidatus Bathyarchaeota archaeon]|nr:MAG: UMP kinase [Candidatus Bathyarchaeota archaeon]
MIILYGVSSLKVVLRIGGSVIASPPNPRLMNEYVEIIRRLLNEKNQVVVVVGGGKPAREFIQLAREMGLEEREQDEVAISASRIIAQLMAMKLGGYGWKDIPKSLSDAVAALRGRGIAVMGGLNPGMTTDAVAALIASEIDADLIIKATNQDGVYTKDPERYADAEKIDEITFEGLSNLLERDKHVAGIHQIIDPEAVRILKRMRVRMLVVNGFNPQNVIAALRGEKIGTIIK